VTWLIHMWHDSVGNQRSMAGEHQKKGGSFRKKKLPRMQNRGEEIATYATQGGDNVMVRNSSGNLKKNCSSSFGRMESNSNMKSNGGGVKENFSSSFGRIESNFSRRGTLMSRYSMCCSGLQWVAVVCSVLQSHWRGTLMFRYSMCCSVFQCVAVCCSVLQSYCCGTLMSGYSLCCSELQCVAVCCHALQCVAVLLAWYSHVWVQYVLQCVVCVAEPCSVLQSYWQGSLMSRYIMCCSMLQRVTACCSVLQHVAACCSVLQRVAACCSVLQRVAVSLVW